jgi:hypothetical protein
MARTGFALTPHIDAGIWVGNRSRDLNLQHTNRVALSHIIVTDNSISDTPRGISVSDTAWKTFLLRNQFDTVETPILDWGAQTIQQGNKVYKLDEQGEHILPLPEKRRN